MEHPGSGPSPILGKPLLFGTVHGAIGLVGQLSSETFSLLSKLQENIAKIITSVGHIEHEVYPNTVHDCMCASFCCVHDEVTAGVLLQC